MNYDDLLRELKMEAVLFPDISAEDLADIIHALENHFDAKKLVEYKASGVSELTEWQKGWNDAIDTIMEDTPTVDAVEVVRCKDCKHYWKNNPSDDVPVCLASPKDDAFCSEGERREDVSN